MPSNFWLIETANATTTNYYLSGSGGKFYDGSGTPWTTQAGTPIRTAMNDTTGGRFTPQTAQTQAIFLGGAPFVSGSELLSRADPNTQQTIPLQIYAIAGNSKSSHDNAQEIKQRLQRALKAALFSTPTVLAVQPNTAASVLYYEVLDGLIQETHHFIGEEAGRGVLRCVMTVTCKPYGGNLAAGQSILSARTFQNTGTGATDNIEAYSAGLGELIYEGQPINLAITRNTADVITGSWYMASVAARQYVADGGAYSTTLSRATVATYTFSAASFLGIRGVKPRLLLRVASASANAVVGFQFVYVNPSAQNYYTSRLITPATATALVDLGTFPLTFFRDARSSSGSIIIFAQLGSTDGLNATATFSYAELLTYYTFAIVPNVTQITTTQGFYVDSFRQRSNTVCLPLPAPLCYGALTSNQSPLSSHIPQGTLPQYFVGASLYLAWLGTTGHSTTEQVIVNATQAPLYRTLRGAS